MKIYIATDLEGVTGVYSFSQTREQDTPANLDARRYLMLDIAAVAQGLKDCGATEIYVLDGHGRGCNFLADHMVPGVRYITGYPRPRPFPLLDKTFAAVILLGYHAMNGVADGVLHHTQSSKAEAKYWYDGVERGEIFQHAVIAGCYDLPVILVTGDEAACREAKATLGDAVPTVAVKKGLSREAAVLIGLEETRRMLAAGARQAMAALPKLKPYKPALPLKMRVRRIFPEKATVENPYYVDREEVVEDPLTQMF
ncbi:MAG TPA: M55 family metallopeptidase [Candidatus Brocadiia bacterium]|nr:M55 family metallopeptidase [Candidatus Brocadiia bacterium]